MTSPDPDVDRHVQPVHLVGHAGEPAAPGHRHHAGHTGGPPPSVWLVDVSVGYEDKVVLEDVDLELAAGSLTAVVGPNGGGKSTVQSRILDECCSHTAG